MTRKKIRDRENRKILSGFRDVADFVTGNRDSIPPLVGPLLDYYVVNYVEVRHKFDEDRSVQRLAHI